MNEEEMRARRKRGVRALFLRYIMGMSAERLLTRDELKEKLNWDDGQTTVNDIRIGLMRDELVYAMEGLREQFAKVATLIAALAFMLGFNPVKDEGVSVVVICIAAIIGVWVQSPRLKIFRFRKRVDTGLRIGSITTQFDVYYYLYEWKSRREELQHAAEALVFILSMAVIGVLAYLGLVSLSRLI